MALLELRAFPSFWPPISPKILQKAGNTRFKLLKCKFSQKLEVLVTKGGFLEKKLTLFNENYICILTKNSNFEYWVLEKTRFLEKIETPGTRATRVQVQYTYICTANSYCAFLQLPRCSATRMCSLCTICSRTLQCMCCGAKSSLIANTHFA